MFFLSFELMAQRKVFLEPYLGFYVGFSKENKEINKNQNIINHYYFGGKDVSIGGKISYKTEVSKYSLGYETSFYVSHYKHLETGLPRIESFHSTGYGEFHSIYFEYARKIIDVKIKMPKSFQKWIKTEKDRTYLLNSKLSPMLGLEYRFIYGDYKNDFNDPHATIRTSQGNYSADIQYLHLNANSNLTMRGGLNWEFYNGDKYKFNIALLYKFAFKDAGYINYHFVKNSNPNISFDYQTTTRGNGFCIYAGFPIKLFSYKKY